MKNQNYFSWCSYSNYTNNTFAASKMLSIPNLFESCLDSLPLRDRKIIKEYWRLVKRHPIIVVDDTRFDTLEEPDAAACVTGNLILHEFYFREYTQSAPRDILCALIKHELAHCFDFAANPEKHPMFDFRPKLGNSTFGIEGGIQRLYQESLKIVKGHLDEAAAVRKNQEWGSDEQALDSWIVSRVRGK